jgi:hypothetical protein
MQLSSGNNQEASKPNSDVGDTRTSKSTDTAPNNVLWQARWL